MSKNLFSSSIEFDDGALERFLREHWNELHDDLEQTMKDQAEEVTTGAKALAPKDEGNLEDAVHNQGVKDKGDSFEAEIKVGGTGTKYAARMHEDQYNPGKITKSKPDYKGHKPGRKYLENAIEANKKDFMEEIKDTVRKHMSR